MKALLFLLILVTIVLSTNALISRKEAKFYEILDSDPDDSFLSIKAKYRKLALKYHPDRNPHDGTTKMRELNEAFDYLSVYLNKGEERTYSVQGLQILDILQKMWDSIPEEQKKTAAATIQEYCQSEYIGEDFVLFFNKVFSPQDQTLWVAWIVAAISTSVFLMVIGFYTVVYMAVRIVWYAVKLAWWLVMLVLRTVLWAVGAGGGKPKAKQQ